MANSRRRKHQKGSVWLRGSSFFIRYYGPDRKQQTEFLCERDEKHHSRTCKAVRTLADVAMAKVNAESEKPSDGPELLVSDFFLRTYMPWVEANKKRSTILSYKQIWAQHLNSHFDSKTLGGYRTSDASKFLTGLAESGLGRNTISHVRSSMSGLFSHSVNLGLIDRNPVSEAKSLSKAKAPSETESHSLREVEDLISALADRSDCQLEQSRFELQVQVWLALVDRRCGRQPRCSRLRNTIVLQLADVEDHPYPVSIIRFPFASTDTPDTVLASNAGR